MIRLSIVIPALGNQADVDNTLLSVLENRPDGTEIVLVHRPDYVDPYDLSDEVRFVESDADSLVGFIQSGFHASRGEYLHVLHSGILVESAWADVALDIFVADRNVGSVSPNCLLRTGDVRKSLLGVQLDAVRGRRSVIGSVKRRKIAERVTGPHLMVGFYRTSALRLLGGWNCSYGSEADLELSLRLLRGGFRHQVEFECHLGPTNTALLAKAYDVGSVRNRATLIGGFGRLRPNSTSGVTYAKYCALELFKGCMACAPLTTMMGLVSATFGRQIVEPACASRGASDDECEDSRYNGRRDAIPAPHFLIPADRTKKRVSQTISDERYR